MDKQQREQALQAMQAASDVFYASVVRIGVHPFIEFTGLMNEYIKACSEAHKKGIDFSACNTHTGVSLPLKDHEIEYINEKLECIFTGNSVIKQGKHCN